MPDPPPPTGDGAKKTIGVGRCHMCGYDLHGIAEFGNCPECGAPYTPESAAKLKPWPSAFSVCWRLLWPTFGFPIVYLLDWYLDGQGAAVIVYGYAMCFALALNGYIQVRRLLKRHLPESRRTRGPIAALRALGTVLAFVVIAALALPVLAFFACLVIFGSGLFNH